MLPGVRRSSAVGTHGRGGLCEQGLPETLLLQGLLICFLSNRGVDCHHAMLPCTPPSLFPSSLPVSVSRWFHELLDWCKFL